MNVTHGAVSRQIKELENWVGRPLFQRHAGRLVATKTGTDYARHVRDALDILRDGTRSLSETSDTIVRISTTASFATEWLMPRLPGFQAQHPGIEIWIEETREIVDPRSGNCDLALRMGTGTWPGVLCTPLMDEILFPVCHPALSEHVKQPDDLGNVTLLHDTDPQAQWNIWFQNHTPQLMAKNGHRFAKGPRFASSSLLLQAAAAGQGVALARGRLARTWLTQQRLVQPLPQTIHLGTAYWLVTRQDTECRKPLRLFLSWLKQEAMKQKDITRLFTKADPAPTS
ncbi:MAG: LysR substrate-binding domain-containing protein [Pseudomonadota bacterium]